MKNYSVTFYDANKDNTRAKENKSKVIFDIEESLGDKSQINKRNETATRFLNTHANEGVSADQFQVAIAIHVESWQDLLTNEA